MKNNKGITLITLIITIIVILIIAGISIGVGNGVIKKSELENLKTNMLLIKVKGKEYVENANFKLGTNIDSAADKEDKISNAKGELKGEEISNIDIFNNNVNITQEKLQEDNANYIYYYKLSTQNLIDMGLTNIKSDANKGFYIVKYDIKNNEVEVYNTKGYEEEEGNVFFSLNEMQGLY